MIELLVKAETWKALAGGSNNLSLFRLRDDVCEVIEAKSEGSFEKVTAKRLNIPSLSPSDLVDYDMDPD
jgi:hypothetical protein